MLADYLIWAGLGVAAIYLVMTTSGASLIRSVVKTLPVLLFALAAWMAQSPAFLVAGLLLSALGDYALSRLGNAAFLYGLASFALAHVLYTLHFLSLSDSALWEAFSANPLLSIAVILMAASAEIWLVPHIDRLVVPVRIYMVLITVMALAAFTLPVGLVTLGALSFVLSDMLLAVALFRMSADNPLYVPTSWAVWITYIGAQALILAGASPLP